MNARTKYIKEMMGNGLVLGILNLSSDSFSGDGITNQDELKDRIEMMLKDGVRAIDVGAQSTRPGSREVREKIEIRKVKDAVTLIRAISEDVIISVDTTRASVARAAISSRCDIINDISGGTFDRHMWHVIKDNPHIFYVLGHVKGTFETMHDEYEYKDLIGELISYAKEKIVSLKDIGIRSDRLIFDPCVGFSKRKEENLLILRNIRNLRSLGVPLLIGLSRKRFIRHITGDDDNGSLDVYSLLLNACALQEGVDIIRTHEVTRTIKAMRLIKELTQSL